MGTNNKRERTAPRKAGCLSKDLRFASRELADDWVQRKAQTTGMSPESWNVYCCRYTKPGRPHYHAGHKPGFIRQYGRMPEHDRTSGRHRKRRHSR